MDILKPHTPEWFAALEKKNPMQAAMTRQVISLAGSDNVCSICGDEEASDYRVETLPDTIRLCEDCLGIQGAGRFVKLS
jgi:hypothetical protein